MYIRATRRVTRKEHLKRNILKEHFFPTEKCMCVYILTLLVKGQMCKLKGHTNQRSVYLKG